MSPLILKVVNMVRRNGFHVEVVVNATDGTAIRVLDVSRNAEAFFHFNRRTEFAVARQLAEAYCTAEQEEAIFADRLQSALCSGGRKLVATAGGVFGSAGLGLPAIAASPDVARP